MERILQKKDLLLVITLALGIPATFVGATWFSSIEVDSHGIFGSSNTLASTSGHAQLAVGQGNILTDGGYNSAAIGQGLIANAQNCVYSGTWNDTQTGYSGSHQLVVGNGTSTTASNVLVVSGLGTTGVVAVPGAFEAHKDGRVIILNPQGDIDPGEYTAP